MIIPTLYESLFLHNWKNDDALHLFDSCLILIYVDGFTWWSYERYLCISFSFLMWFFSLSNCLCPSILFNKYLSHIRILTVKSNFYRPSFEKRKEKNRNWKRILKTSGNGSSKQHRSLCSHPRGSSCLYIKPVGKPERYVWMLPCLETFRFDCLPDQICFLDSSKYWNTPSCISWEN